MSRSPPLARTSAPLLVFVDDDAVLGDERVIERLVAPLLADPSIGVTGASKLLPPDAPWFQRWVARVAPYVPRVSASFLIGAGIFLINYWWTTGQALN